MNHDENNQKVVILPKQANPRPSWDMMVLPVEGVVRVPHLALLRLALVLHDIKRSYEVEHVKAA